MTFLFFGGLIILIFGLASMNWVGILLGAGALAYAVHRIDARQTAANALNMVKLERAEHSKSNGHVKDVDYRRVPDE